MLALCKIAWFSHHGDRPFTFTCYHFPYNQIIVFLPPKKINLSLSLSLSLYIYIYIYFFFLCVNYDNLVQDT